MPRKGNSSRKKLAFKSFLLKVLENQPIAKRYFVREMSADNLARNALRNFNLPVGWQIINGQSARILDCAIVGLKSTPSGITFDLHGRFAELAPRETIAAAAITDLARRMVRDSRKTDLNGGAVDRPHDYSAARDLFLRSSQWQALRYATLQRFGARCLCCNTDRSSGKVMHVDHIKPMWTHWHLRADPENLQVLCEDCNMGKGARDSTDWR